MKQFCARLFYREKRQDLTYTIATFNIKRVRSEKAKNSFANRAEAVTDFFEKVSPDILGTQELTKNALEKLESFEIISQNYARIGEPRTATKGEYTAIFYKKELFELVESGTFWLSKSPEKKGSSSWLSLFPRICTWCILRPKNGGNGLIRVYNTHLDCLSPFARVKGIELIRRLAEKHDSDKLCGTVIMGDFNARPTSKTVKKMLEQGEQTVVRDSFSILYRLDPENARTYHGFRGKMKGAPIDYIFTTKRIDILSAYIDRTAYGEIYPSDHFPVVAKIETKEEENGHTVDH